MNNLAYDLEEEDELLYPYNSTTQGESSYSVEHPGTTMFLFNDEAVRSLNSDPKFEATIKSIMEEDLSSQPHGPTFSHDHSHNQNRSHKSISDESATAHHGSEDAGLQFTQGPSEVIEKPSEPIDIRDRFVLMNETIHKSYDPRNSKWRATNTVSITEREKKILTNLRKVDWRDLLDSDKVEITYQSQSESQSRAKPSGETAYDTVNGPTNRNDRNNDDDELPTEDNDEEFTVIQCKRGRDLLAYTLTPPHEYGEVLIKEGRGKRKSFDTRYIKKITAVSDKDISTDYGNNRSTTTSTSQEEQTKEIDYIPIFACRNATKSETPYTNHYTISTSLVDGVPYCTSCRDVKRQKARENLKNHRERLRVDPN
ncbi:uncharacterized protein L201_007671 [Kwoniella dendrophila CBS 6074]|uniref:Uncharacterized protein n=1 Tax=Kwoniella dendrophila CBS 6074 TaxID=1295534 RepID=A0AAX4K766_9TREE